MYTSILLHCYIISLSGPIDRSIAHEVIKTNTMKIVMSGVDVFLLATSLNSRNAIAGSLYREIIDSLTGLSTDKRLTKLLSDVNSVVQANDGAFKKVLLSLAECGQQQLSTELYQQYCSMIGMSQGMNMYIVIMIVYLTGTSATPQVSAAIDISDHTSTSASTTGGKGIGTCHAYMSCIHVMHVVCHYLYSVHYMYIK